MPAMNSTASRAVARRAFLAVLVLCHDFARTCASAFAAGLGRWHACAQLAVQPPTVSHYLLDQGFDVFRLAPVADQARTNRVTPSDDRVGGVHPPSSLYGVDDLLIELIEVARRTVVAL